MLKREWITAAVVAQLRVGGSLNKLMLSALCLHQVKYCHQMRIAVTTAKHPVRAAMAATSDIQAPSDTTDTPDSPGCNAGYAKVPSSPPSRRWSQLNPQLRALNQIRIQECVERINPFENSGLIAALPRLLPPMPTLNHQVVGRFNRRAHGLGSVRGNPCDTTRTLRFRCRKSRPRNAVHTGGREGSTNAQSCRPPASVGWPVRRHKVGERDGVKENPPNAGWLNRRGEFRGLAT